RHPPRQRLPALAACSPQVREALRGVGEETREMIGSSTGLPPRWREQASSADPGSATSAEARAAALFRAELAPRPASAELLAEIRMRPMPARPRAAWLPLRWVLAGGILALGGASFAAYHAVQVWR